MVPLVLRLAGACGGSFCDGGNLERDLTDLTVCLSGADDAGWRAGLAGLTAVCEDAVERDRADPWREHVDDVRDPPDDDPGGT